MPFDSSRAIGAYAAVVTLALAWTVLGGATHSANDARFGTIDVERINVREPDGTLRMTIAGRGRMPGIIVGDKEYPHPNRPEAGMLFFNRDGIENGGLVFDGQKIDGKSESGGSLTFDRYKQDQIVQLFGTEEGKERSAGIRVNDYPDAEMDFAAGERAGRLPDGPAKDAAYRAANIGVGRQRAFLGRSRDGASQLQLRDGAGKVRVAIKVAENGTAAIEFFDAAGKATRTISAE